MTKRIYDRKPGHFGFYCPGCDDLHVVPVDGSRGWSVDTNLESPTLAPSVLTTLTRSDGLLVRRCHLFVRAGQIEYLTDSTHELSGKTIPIPDLPEDLE